MDQDENKKSENKRMLSILIIATIIGSILIIIGFVHPDNKVVDPSSSIDLKNWATLLVEIGVAIYISVIVYYVSFKQQNKTEELTRTIAKIVEDKQEHDLLQEQNALKPLNVFLTISREKLEHMIDLESQPQTIQTQQTIDEELRQLTILSNHVSTLPDTNKIRTKSIIDDYGVIALEIALLCDGTVKGKSKQEIISLIDKLMKKLPN